MAQADPLLSVRNVNIGYRTDTGTVKAVVGATFDLHPGDTLGLVGESGSGKSTLAHGILRLLPSNAVMTGEIEFLGSDLVSCREPVLRKLRWKEMAIVFQKSMNCLSPVHRVGDQVLDVMRVHEPRATRQEAYERMRALLSVVNLSDRVLDLYPHQLSGGMLQRVSISLSLLLNPRLVILDEATTALDVVTQGQVLEEIRRLQQEMGVASILITHDVSVVAETCRRVAVMYAGYIVEMGPVTEVLLEPCHPYTRGLLASLPSLRGARTRIHGIPGSLPDLKASQPGCVFAPRCSQATECCRMEVPVVSVADGRIVRCHLYGGGQM